LSCIPKDRVPHIALKTTYKVWRNLLIHFRIALKPSAGKASRVYKLVSDF
jgi:hypothetical protein